jgi:hypothetical protein
MASGAVYLAAKQDWFRGTQLLILLDYHRVFAPVRKHH